VTGPYIVYSNRYTVHGLGFERLHPFDLNKYRRAWARLRREFGDRLSEARAAPQRPLTPEQLRLVHTERYLASLSDPETVAAIVEVPQLAWIPAGLLERALLRPVRWGCAGTIVALRLALDQGEAINLGGGFHHASQDRGEGFCLYADAAIALAELRNEGTLRPEHRVICVDLDAHMGNGFARCVRDDPRVAIFDMYNGEIYPFDPEAEARIDQAIPLPVPTYGDAYLETLFRTLPGFLDDHANGAAVALYNAGTDIYEQDVLGGLSVPFRDVIDRDRFVIDQFRERGLPWAMITSGGYSDASHRLIADTAAWVLRTGAMN